MKPKLKKDFCSSMKRRFCTKHVDTALEDTECFRCDGKGYTESDIEAEWYSDGSCYQCKGSGVIELCYCWKCEEGERELEGEQG